MPRVGGGSGGAPSGNAGGVLGGTYPNPSFAADMATQAELNAAQATLDAKRLDQIAAPTADVSLNNQKIIGLAAPSASTEAANKAYVDAIAQGFDVKMSVRAATTANITLSGAQTIDGAAVIATNRVLVKNQTSASENGIYVAAAGAWARSADADADAEVTAGLFTFVEEGSTYADQGWALATNNPITLGTTALSFTQVAGTAGGGSPTGAAGGDLAGSTYPNPVIANGAVTVAKLSFDPATQTELDAHVNDTSAAHAAASISFTPDGSISATTVQAAIVEVRDEAGVGGGSVNDQTIVTTDNTVNNATTAKHGWSPKLDNNRSHYYGGKGEWNIGHGVKEWFVDETVVSGGDGHSAAGAFTTFAAAMAAAQPRDAVYLLSDMNQDLDITVQDLHVIGVGTRVITGSGSSSIGARTVRVGFGAHRCTLENLYIVGHANFKGVHLCLDVADQVKLRNIRINGTNGVDPTNYPYASPASPYPQSTGIGGVGILSHQSEHSVIEQIEITRCAIAIALGTWSTQITIRKVRLDANVQHFVEGLHSGPNGSPALTTALGYSQNGVSNSHVGNNTFEDWQAVASVVGTMPVMELVGDGTTNYDGDQGGNDTFINVNVSEGGVTPVVRIGTRNNTFIGCSNPGSCTWNIHGQHNRVAGMVVGGLVNYTSDYNTFEDPLIQDAPLSGWIQGSGSYTTLRNAVLYSVTGVPISHTGSNNTFDKCQFLTTSGAAPTRSSFGSSLTIIWSQGSYAATYGTTVGPAAHVPTGLLNVTNGTAFTISNPVDPTNSGDTSKILCTTPIRLIILNSSGGAMGAITWGSKFKLAGAFVNPANGKRRTIDFFYDFPNDVWVETARAAADIG